MDVSSYQRSDIEVSDDSLKKCFDVRSEVTM